jgi:glycyl-tRNA synthetase beta subunit
MLAAAACLSLFATACGTAEVSAEAAIGAMEEAFNTVKTEASEYLPEDAKSIEDSLDKVKKTLAEGDYRQALTDVQELAPSITSLQEAVTVKKAELTAAWEGLGGNLPAAVSGIRERLETLDESDSLPAGLTGEIVAAARTVYDTIVELWNQATSAFESGMLTDAMSLAQQVKTKVVEVMTSLGMPVPEALK